MSSGSDGRKTMRLMSLENWARGKYPSEKFPTREFKAALGEYCLITWGVSDSAADNMARIVQLRMTRTMPKSLEPVSPPTAEEEGLSILEMIQGHRAAHPEEYRPPKTDFEVQED